MICVTKKPLAYTVNTCNNGFLGVTMRKYRFSVDGIYVTLYSASFGYDRAGILDELQDNELAVALLPDLRADFRVEMFDKSNNEPREPRLCFAALFCFFEKVCAYPDMTLEIAYKDDVIPMEVRTGTAYKFSVKVGKCKSLGRDKIKFPDGIEVEYHIIGGKIPTLAVICEDSDLFDKYALSRILENGRRYGAQVALAISSSGALCIKQVGISLPCEVIEAALTALLLEGVSIKGGGQVAFILGGEYDFSTLGKELTFYPRVKYLS